MTLPAHLLPQTASHSRRSDDVVVAQSFPFDTAMDHALDPGLLLMCVATGLGADLSVVIDGELNQVVQSETVTVLSAVGQALSTKYWTRVTNVAVAASQAGTLRVSLRDSGNQPVFLQTVLDAALKVRLKRRRVPRVEIANQGAQYVETFACYTQPNADLRTADRLVVDGSEYEVDHVYKAFGKSVHHHSESVVRLIS